MKQWPFPSTDPRMVSDPAPTQEPQQPDCIDEDDDGEMCRCVMARPDIDRARAYDWPLR